MYKRLDMFLSVVTKPQLCIWWLIAQRNINIANSCKVMFKLLCCENALCANTGRYTDVPYEL